MLTTGTDNFSPTAAVAANKTTAGNDTFEATGKTFTALDYIDAGEGTDKIIIKDADGVMNTAVPSGITLKSVESMEIQTAGSLGVAAVAGQAAQAARKQVDAVTIANGNGDTFDVTWGTVTVTTSAATSDADALTKVAAALNAIAGSTVATVVGSQIVVTAPVAGTALNYGVVEKTNDGTASAIVQTTSQTNLVAQDAITAVTAVAYDVSGFTDVADVAVTTSNGMALKAAATQNVTVSGSTGTVTVEGGKNVTVTDATADKAITLSTGAATGNAVGAITVTDTNQGNAAIVVDGGTTVTVTASTDKATSGNITIGANKAASGAVVVTQNTTNNADAAITAGNIAVTGGSTVTVNVNATNTATKDSVAANNITAGTVTVTGDSATTAVTVNQNVVANDYASVTTGATKETATITFGALKAGEKVAIHEGALTALGTDLTFTASKDLTAEEVAAAFASLTAADKQAAGGIVANGIFTGTLDAGWTSDAASGASVTFTATTAGPKTDLAVTAKKADGTTDVANVASFTKTKVDGSAGSSTTARNVTANYGAVTIQDNATAAITDVTVNGYGTLNIGTTGALSKLANLSLTNSAGIATIGNGSAASLNLTVNNVAHAVSIDNGGATVTTLNATATGADSSFALTAAAVKDLTVSGDKKLTLTGTTTALETVTVTGSASLDISGVSANAAKSINTTGTTGTVTAKIDASAATYTGGAGVDNVTLTADAITKAISLGAGDDTLKLKDATTTVPTVTISGGDGVDTISMTVASAASFGSTTAFANKISSFERLTLNNSVDVNAANATVNLENLGFSYVTTSGVTNNGTNKLILDNMANNGTVVLTATAGTAGIEVNVKDATEVENASDVLNVIARVAGGVTHGTLTAAGVETIKLTTEDTTPTDINGNPTIDTSTLTLSVDSAATINIDGNADLALTLAAAAKLTKVDASNLTGVLSLTADGKASGTEVIGGKGDDILTSKGEGDILRGGEGNDTFYAVGDLTKVEGGAGADTFHFFAATNLAKVSSVIGGLNTGDTFKLFIDDNDGVNGGTGNGAFNSDDTLVDVFFAEGAQYNANVATSVALRVEASLEQAANKGEATWFNFGNFTYIVVNADGNNTYNAGTDVVIEIAGVYNLGTQASFNSGFGTLEIA